jgi:hypothetical protein
VRTSLRRVLLAIASLALAISAGEAQSVTQFWPEVDYFQQLSGQSRIMLQALGAVGSDSVGEDQQYGINYDFSFRPRRTIDRLLGAQSLADDRRQPLQVRLGYRYQETIGDKGLSVQNRLIAELTFRWALAGLTTADRNGFDFRWTNGEYSTRYRNRLMIERPVKTRGYEWTPYGDVEAAYTFSNDRWSYVKYEAGVQLPVLRHLTAEVYGGLQNSWTSQPDQVYAFGLTLVVSY